MDNEYNKYLFDKKIILVGPSPSLLSKNNGKLIDSYDIVCRIKKSYPVPTNLKTNIGIRTDILISHLKLTGRGYIQNNFGLYDNIIFNKLKYILFPFPKEKNYNVFYKEYQNACKSIKTPIIHQENKTTLEYLKNELNGYSPTTGLAGIVDLLNYEIKELYVTGMTFQQDGFAEYDKTKKETEARISSTKNYHNMKNELIFFKKLIEKDTRLLVDSTLQEILDKVDTNVSLDKPIVRVNPIIDRLERIKKAKAGKTKTKKNKIKGKKRKKVKE